MLKNNLFLILNYFKLEKNNNYDEINNKYINNNTTFCSLTIKCILRYCLIFRGLILLLIVGFFHLYGGQSHYLKFGPQPDFKILDIEVNTWPRYHYVLFSLIFITTISALIKEIGNPIIKFYVYNPHAARIDNISKVELQFLTNSLQSMDIFIELFTVATVISKFDILLIVSLIRSIIPIFTVYYLLKDKTFND